MFNHLPDDTPLPANEVSSSVLVSTYSHVSLQNGKGVIGGGKPGMSGEIEKGLLTLIFSDGPDLVDVEHASLWSVSSLCLLEETFQNHASHFLASTISFFFLTKKKLIL